MTTKKKNPTKMVTGISRPNPPHATIAHLRQEVKEHKETIRLLNDECRLPRLTEQEIAESKRLREEHDRAYADINALAMWLRTNKSAEIARGDHNGRSLADVVIGYLAKGLILENVR